VREKVFSEDLPGGKMKRQELSDSYAAFLMMSY